MTAYTDLERPTIFAHRGSSVYAPENTLAAFQLALDQNVAAIELDARLTADGQIVVFHDETLERTTDGSGRVSSLTLAELKSLDAGIKFNPTYRSERIPTLEEVFALIGSRAFINIELKNILPPVSDLPDRVISLAKKHGLEHNIMLSSFNPVALIRSRSLLPKAPLGFLVELGMANLALRSGLIKFGPLLALHPRFEDVKPALLQAAHRRKCRIHPFTVKQPEQMLALFKMGVDGLFADDPLLARKVLDGMKHETALATTA